MGNEEFESKGRKMVSDWICNHEPMSTDISVYCVWFSKTLQNAKGLFSADRNDGLYFEITYNGDKDEFYLDVYRKLENNAISNYICDSVEHEDTFNPFGGWGKTEDGYLIKRIN